MLFLFIAEIKTLQHRGAQEALLSFRCFSFLGRLPCLLLWMQWYVPHIVRMKSACGNGFSGVCVFLCFSEQESRRLCGFLEGAVCEGVV